MQILSTLLFIFLCSVVIINGTPITTTPEGKFEDFIHLYNNYAQLNDLGEISNVEIDEAGEDSNNRSDEATKCLDRTKLTSKFEDFCYRFPIDDTNGKALNLLAIFKIMENADPAEDPLKMCFAIFRNNDLLPLRSISQSFKVFVIDVLLKRIRPLIMKDGDITSPVDRRFLPAYKTLDDMHSDTLVLARCQFKFLFNISDGLESAKHELGEGAYFAKWLGFWPPIEYIIFNNSKRWLYEDSIFIPKAYIPNIASFLNVIYSKLQEAKLVFIFSDCSWSLMESVVFSDIFSIRKNRSLPICYIGPSETSNEITEIFDIEPFSMNFPAEWGKVIGLVHHNSTTNSLNNGQAKRLVEMLEDKDV
ncbi:hypothetical protein DINM_006846 [Dirofilaria immitis]|nr:hypothetical protein [Dirofilaria immitis]